MNRFTNFFKPLMWSTTLVLVALVAGCGGGSNHGAGAVVDPNSAAAGPTGSVSTAPGSVALGTAGNYVILAQTGVDTVPNSLVTGNIGLSPGAKSLLTGWSKADDVTDTYATSAQVVPPGKLYAANNIGGSTSVDLTTAVADMQTAHTNANGMSPAGGALPGGVPGTACPGAGNFGGLTIAPGVYTCTVVIDIPTGTNVTLSGAGAYVFRTTAGITQASGTQVILTNGALAKDVFWVPAMTVSIVGTAGAITIMNGVILAKTDINVGTNATVYGRLLAQTAVNIGQATITAP